MNMEQSFMPYLVAFGWMAALLLFGTFLRAKIPFFQKYLFPSSLIAGLLGFCLVSLGLVGIPSMDKGWVPVPNEAFGMLAFHLFSFGFVAIGLGSGGKSSSGTGKDVLKGSLWMSLVFTLLACVQSLVGGGIFAAGNAAMGTDFYSPLGFLIGHGFTQGPGQTLAIAGVWQSKMNIADAVSVGLAFAAVGFFVAALVGVPLAYWGVKKGYATNAPQDLPRDFLVGLMDKDSDESVGRHTTHPGNIDTIAYHLAVMGIVYLLSYYLCFFLKNYVYPASLSALTFGFIFFYGLVIAVVLRKIMNTVGAGHLIDDNVQRRITGTTVDFMIVSVMMAVQITTIWKYIVPIAISLVLVTIITLVLIIYYGRRVPGFGFERMLAMFGYCTGTGASGLLLLRIVDPQFKTPVAIEVGLMNLFALFFFTHIVFLVTMVPAPSFPNISGMLLIYLITIAVSLILLKALGLWKKKQF